MAPGEGQGVAPQKARRPHRAPSLKRRLVVMLVVQTVAVLLLTSAALFLVLGRFLKAGEERRLEQLVGRVSVHLSDRDHEVLELKDDFPNDVHVRVVRGGEVLAQTPGFPPVPLALPSDYSVARDHQVLSRELRDDGRRFTLQLAGDLGGIRAPLRAYLMALAVIVPLAAAAVAGLSTLVARNMLAPVRRLEGAAVALTGSRQLRDELPGTASDDELGRLARTLQATFARLADGLDREVEFVRAAAHDLRSPLTALKTRIEGALARPRDTAAYRATLRELGRDVDGMTHLVEHLLMLAREEAPAHLRPVDLVTLVAEAVDRAREASPDVPIVAELARDTPRVEGDPTLLAQLVSNLLGNAVLHGEGAAVTVTCGRGAGGGALLRVADEGPGVAPHHLERLGQPFYRADPARARQGGGAGGDTGGDTRGGPGRGASDAVDRQGSGLGLAIVKRVVEWHGASWRLESAAGEGFSVTVEFPA